VMRRLIEVTGLNPAKHSLAPMVGAGPSLAVECLRIRADAPITLCGQQVRRTRTQTRRSAWAFGQCCTSTRALRLSRSGVHLIDLEAPVASHPAMICASVRPAIRVIAASSGACTVIRASTSRAAAESGNTPGSRDSR